MLRNMKIRKKLVITFVLVSVLSSVAGIIGLFQMKSIDAAYSSALSKFGYSQGDIGAFHAEFNNNRSILRDVIDSADPDTKNTNISSLSESDIKLDALLEKVKMSSTTEAEKKLYNVISDSLAKFRDASDQAVGLAKQNKTLEALMFMTNQCTPRSNTIRRAIEELISLNTAEGNKISKSISDQTVRSVFEMAAVILVGLMVSLLVVLSTARGISKPVHEMVEAAQKMSEGDLSVEIGVKSNDEIGRLGSAFRESTASIRSYIKDISIKYSAKWQKAI